MLTTLPPPCAVAMKSGNLKFLEPSGPLQACNGTALPFYIGTWLLVINYGIHICVFTLQCICYHKLHLHCKPVSDENSITRET